MKSTNKISGKSKDDFLSILPAPARRALENQGITTLKKLAANNEADLLKLHGFGPGSIPKLKAVLNENGLRFKDSKSKPTKD